MKIDDAGVDFFTEGNSSPLGMGVRWAKPPYLEQPSLASKKRQWSVKIHGQFFNSPLRLAKVEEVGLYQNKKGVFVRSSPGKGFSAPRLFVAPGRLLERQTNETPFFSPTSFSA